MTNSNVSPLNDAVAIRREIQSAAKTDIAIRISRDDIEDGYMNGFVAAIGQSFFVIELISDSIYLDGFVCLRFEDVSHVESPAPHWKFLQQALCLRNQQRAEPLGVDCKTTYTLLTSIPRAVELVTLHSEKVDSEVCFIGRIASVNEEALTLDTVSPEAEWHTEGMEIWLSDITQINFGGAYEDALFQVISSRKS
ncbi:MAG: hypothetical protein AAF351_00950 [Pseudomonadota bacterium]